MADYSDWGEEGGREHPMAKFERWERKAKKENSDTMANIKEEEENG
jgi:hypothetical protein